MRKCSNQRFLRLFLTLPLLIGILGLVLTVPSYTQSLLPQPGSRITFPQAQAMLEANPEALLIDVRTQVEFDAGYIPGALLLPNTSINRQTAAQVIPTLETPVVIYCRSGARSAQAARTLISLGYTRIYDLGPITAWRGALATNTSSSSN
jgi:rhodanese-related sulfurtransferase